MNYILLTSPTLRRITGTAAFVALLLLATLLLSPERSTSGAPAQQTSPPSPTTTTQPSKPILLTDPVPDPKQPGVLWFAQTGHTLRGAFLDYWNRYGGLAQFGYPLTEEFFEPVGTDNKLYQVQYFERNRFEYHPENNGTQYEVLLGVLGLDFRKADPPASPVSASTYFKETGHNLSGKFKEYWDRHGGLFVHGFPITEPAMEKSTNGKEYLVQWFERSRFELHPENAGSLYEVLLGVLGRQLSEKKGYPFGWYPLWGRAPDFSWVAGDVFIYNGNTACTSTDCGCAIVRVESRFNTIMQMVSASRPRDFIADLNISDEEREAMKTGARPLVVVFGRPATPAERYYVCPAYPNAMGYLVTHAQRNPITGAP